MELHVSFIRSGLLAGIHALLALLSVFSFSQAVQCETHVSTNCIWGAVTNGVRLGVEVHSVKTGQGEPPICVFYIENVSTNLVYVRLPKLNDRYRICLRQEDGQLAKRIGKPLSGVVGIRYQGLAPNQPSHIDHFSIRDAFQVPTNGRYDLVVSVQVVASPRPEDVWDNKVSYFSMPFVTNSFSVSNVVNLMRLTH